MVMEVEQSQLSVKSIFHPTDFSESSLVAFGHALKLAMSAGADLKILNVAGSRAEAQTNEFPQVRATLARWEKRSQGNTQQAQGGNNLRIEKVRLLAGNPTESILQYLAQKPTDLIVLATSQREGLARWLRGSVSEPVARRSRVMTLFVPMESDGFVSFEDGQAQLRHILIPVDHRPNPQSAVDAASAVASAFGAENVSFRLLHIGDEASVPTLQRTERPGWSWDTILGRGDVVDEILNLCSERSADLIVMATEGHQGFLDALRGSTTERVLRGASCPLLAVPAA